MNAQSPFAPFAKLSDLHERTAPFAAQVRDTAPPFVGVELREQMAKAIGQGVGRIEAAMALIAQGRTDDALAKLDHALAALCTPLATHPCRQPDPALFDCHPEERN